MKERDLAELRREYAAEGLCEDDLPADPLAMFRRWMHDTVTAGLHEPNAMVLSTVSASGAPSARMVLLKGLDERGFCFYTNYSSRKAVELAAQPGCALLFPWHPLQRQVRIEGTALRMTPAENQAYFDTRPRASQIGAWASPQSEEVADRAVLDASYDAVASRFGREEPIPVPPHWGGYRVEPHVLEFWQGRPGRMHDRLRYRRTDAGWAVARLAP
jgi:pyridoxamine 5'-phosphate oxidase